MISLGFCELVTALTLIFVIFFNGEDGIQADRVTGKNFLALLMATKRSLLFNLILCV